MVLPSPSDLTLPVVDLVPLNVPLSALTENMVKNLISANIFQPRRLVVAPPSPRGLRVKTWP